MPLLGIFLFYHFGFYLVLLSLIVTVQLLGFELEYGEVDLFALNFFVHNVLF